MEKKILVATDGSVYSSNSLDYLIRLFHKDTNFSVHLLAVVSTAGSDQNWMFDVDPLRGVSKGTDQKTATALRYLKDAEKRLLRNGFDGTRITSQTMTSHASIATAIHHAAIQGKYDALLVGRRGIGMVGEMFFGSVSSYLVENCHEIPLWIIDGEVTSTSFLLAVHAVPASLMAADHLAFMLRGSGLNTIYLYHSAQVFGGRSQVSRQEFHHQWGKQWCDRHLDLDNHLFGAHARILEEGGIESSRITRLPVQRDIDPSHDLLRQAKKHRCGTIVIGRRGREARKGLLHRVSDRTMHNAQNMAVWLIG